MTWVAYVDESMRQRRDGTGIYVIAAAVVDLLVAEVQREALLRSIRRRRPFHWRFEEPADQRKAVATVADLECLHLVVIGSRLDLRRQERARRRCLERLLWALQDAGVETVWLDARSSKLNKRDVELVDAHRTQGVINDALRIWFASPFNGRDGEVLLWLPDIVAGAVSAGYGDDQHLVVLESLITEHLIDLA